MLDIELGGNPSSIIMLTSDQFPEPNRPVYTLNPEAHFAAPQNLPVIPNPDTHNFAPSYDLISAYKTAGSTPYNYPQQQLSLEQASGPTGFIMVPKSEPSVDGRMGLNLGGRTFFASAEHEDDFLSRVYLRSRGTEPGWVMNSPRCQVEGCSADLSHAKHYHRRHKVCEFHSKAATVVSAGGLTQRFCQQCSRFHLLSEFDNGKRSCRRRLADHNRRRRKSTQSNQDNIKSQIINSNSPKPTSSQIFQRPQPPYPDADQVTVAISPAPISIECSAIPPRRQVVDRFY